jgi:hypothetical protein
MKNIKRLLMAGLLALNLFFIPGISSAEDVGNINVKGTLTVAGDTELTGLTSKSTLGTDASGVVVEGSGLIASDLTPYSTKTVADGLYLGISAKAADADKLDSHDTAYFQIAGSYLVAGDITGKEDTSNKVTSISSGSTDTQYPSAKLLYDQLATKQGSGSYLTSESDPTVDTSAEIQAIIGAGVYDASGAAAGVTPTTLGLVIGTNTQVYDADLTTYAGITPTANAQTILGETFAQMQASLSVDDLITLSGVAEGSVNLATFTGSTIADNVTNKAALQALETAVEGKQATVTEGSLADSTIVSADIKDGTIAGGDLATNIAITTTGLTTANGSLKVGNAGATAGVLTLLEDTDDGSNYASFNVPALAGNTVYTLPADDGDAGEQLQTNGTGTLSWEAAGSGSGAPTDADYLVGTANGSLSAEIVVGTTPGGELAGTWGTPTIDDTGITLTSLTVGSLLGVDSIDATGAVDMDYGSADITDHTFVTDGGTVILDGNINSSTLTASEILITDASKNLISAAVATYPSLTELSYVKGLSSAVQTQIGGKQATVTEGSLADSTILSADIKNGEIVTGDLSATAGITLAQTAMTAGRSLTIATNDVAADAELYTQTKCIYWENPVATDDFKSIWYTPVAATLTKIWAESDQTVTFMLQVDDGSPADADDTDLAPAAGVASDTALNGDATLAAGDRLDMAVTSVANTPTWCSVCWEYTYDD